LENKCKINNTEWRNEVKDIVKRCVKERKLAINKAGSNSIEVDIVYDPCPNCYNLTNMANYAQNPDP